MKIPDSKTDPDILVSVNAQLHLFDAVEGVFMLQDENVIASVQETGPWECTPCVFDPCLSLDWLSVNSSTRKAWISQQMEAEMNPVFNYVRASPKDLLTFRNICLSFGTISTTSQELIPGFSDFKMRRQRRSSRKVSCVPYGRG